MSAAPGGPAAAGRAPDPGPFRPHPLLASGHLQTIATALPRRFTAEERHVDEEAWVRVDAGTEVRLRCRWQADASAPVLLLLHGLTGSAEAAYMLGIAAKAARAGLHTVRLDLRNCGGTEAHSDTLYHSGLTADLDAAVRWLVDRGVGPIRLAGYSIGGNQVLKWLGEQGSRAPVDAAVVVSPPIGLEACARALDQRLGNRLYLRYFLRELEARVAAKERVFGRRWRPEGRDRFRRMRDFDAAVTAPAFGYASAEDYYADASSLRLLADIARPVTILAARDDPLVPFELFRDPRLRRSTWLGLEASDRGGHCGFVARTTSRCDGWWAEGRVVALLG